MDGCMYRRSPGRKSCSYTPFVWRWKIWRSRKQCPVSPQTSIQMLGRYIATMRRIEEVQGNVADAGASFHNLLYMAGRTALTGRFSASCSHA